MRRPSLKLILFFVAGTVIGYAAVIGLLMPLLDVSFRQFSFGWVSTVAILIGMVLVIIADSPFQLRVFDWPEEREIPPVAERPAAERTERTTHTEEPTYQAPKVAAGRFPYESQAEHWDIDFSDSHQTYEGAELPIWLLAGWAAFILWAVIYLISGLPGAF